MAFGFDAPVRGVAVTRPETAQGLRRYLAAFADAYADEVRFVCGNDAALPGQPRADLLFSLDARDAVHAAALGARFVPCFPDPRLAAATESDGHTGTSGTGGRRPLLRICLFGPESTGKSTLAAALAARYQTYHVTEYVRGYLDATGSQGLVEDVPWIARGQRAAAIATEERCERLVISDTNLATVLLWSEFLFGAAPAWLRGAARDERFDLWLVTDIDVPFEPDPQRCFPDAADRARLMAACRGMLDRLGIPGLTLSGSHDARMATARAAIDALIARSS